MFTPLNCSCEDAHELEETALNTKYGLADFFRQKLRADAPSIKGADGRQYCLLREGYDYDIRAKYKDYLVFYWTSRMFRKDEITWSLVRVCHVKRGAPGHSSCFGRMPVPCPWQTKPVSDGQTTVSR